MSACFVWSDCWTCLVWWIDVVSMWDLVPSLSMQATEPVARLCFTDLNQAELHDGETISMTLYLGVLLWKPTFHNETTFCNSSSTYYYPQCNNEHSIMENFLVVAGGME